MDGVQSFARRDLDEVCALQQGLDPGHPWTPGQAVHELTDLARGGGARVRVFRRAGRICGVAGFVDVGQGDGEYYGSPLLVADEGAGRELTAWLLAEARARQGLRLRISARPHEAPKRAVLRAAGFAPIFSFLDMEWLLEGPPEAPPALPGLRPVPPSALDPAALAALANRCFEAVENSPPMTPAQVGELLASEACWPEATRVWADPTGAYRAYLIATRDGTVDAVGVHPEWRGRHLGRALVLRLAVHARAHGLPRLRALIASNNLASLGLHRGLGFVEVARREVWQRDLDPGRYTSGRR